MQKLCEQTHTDNPVSLCNSLCLSVSLCVSVRVSVHTASACLNIVRALVSNSMGFGCSTPWCSVCIRICFALQALQVCPCLHPAIPGGSPVLHTCIHLCRRPPGLIFTFIFISEARLESFLQQDCELWVHIYTLSVHGTLGPP